MSSASPGHVKTGASPKKHTHNTPNDALAAEDHSAALQRATSQKRARDSPATPSRTRALALLGSITDSVRTGAVRGLRALTDTIERNRDDESTSSGSDPPSPTTARSVARSTPKGKRRRTVLTEARTRSSHANWRGAQWDYSGAMEAQLFYRVGDTGPSTFSFPRTAVAPGIEGARMEVGDEREVREDQPATRPSSVMSTASAPAAFSTPQSHTRRQRTPDAESEHTDGQGWVTTFSGAQDDPFVSDDGHEHVSEVDSAQDEQYSPLAEAVSEAASLLHATALQSPAACGAIHDFLVRLRSLDPHGNFAMQCPTGDVAISEIRELRETVHALREAQEDTARSLRTLLARQTTSADAHSTPEPPSTPTTHPPPDTAQAVQQTVTTAQPEESSAKGQDARPGPTKESTQRDAPAPKEVGRHDERRAVFCPATAFGGRITAPASADQVRRLNNASYQVRDAVNTALRDQATSVMADPTAAVQVVGVNWTERGNLCAVVCDGFTAPQLLAHADIVASAAGLGTSYSAHRDVPIFKAVLCNVPTKKTDGSLFTEAEVLADLRTHSTVFDSLKLADSAEPARWISTTGVRELKPRSTLLLNFATARDAETFMALHRRLFAFGCMCEPGAFQPRDRDRICTRCWNPQTRHRERDFVCRERCRLCGGEHIEEDHSCTDCDVLAKPCEHIKLRCVNCGLEHAADDSTCEYRRRTRGVSQSAPPMSNRAPTRETTKAARAAPKRKPKKKNVRILEPHEPFPEEESGAPEPADHPRATSPHLAATHSPAPLVSASTALGTPSPPVQSVQREESGRPTRGVVSTGQSVQKETTREQAHQQPEGEEAELDEAEKAALNDLIGAGNVRGNLAIAQDSPATSGAESSATPHRASSTRIAAAEAAREGKRRRVAHVLVRNFKFLTHQAAVVALKQRMDDHVSTVSWAAEEQAKKNKPGMQGKTEAGLRRIVDEMNKMSADQPHAANTANHTDTTAPDVVNA